MRKDPVQPESARLTRTPRRRKPNDRGERLFGHGDLRFLILSLLDEKPRHGYDLIKALEELSSGVYTPSPGSIYPTLTFLVDHGWASTTVDLKKKHYSITELGRTALDERQHDVAVMRERFAMKGQKLSKLKHWMGHNEAERVGRNDRSPLRASMHRLKMELFQLIEASPEKKQKVADVIDQATQQIKQIVRS